MSENYILNIDPPDEVQTGTFAGDLQYFLELDAEKKDLQEKLAETKKDISTVMHRLIEHFAMLGMDNTKIGDKVLYRRVERYVSIKGDCREAAVEKAVELGLDDMIVLQPARFKAWFNEESEMEGEAGKEFTDLVNVHEAVQIRVRSA